MKNDYSTDPSAPGTGSPAGGAPRLAQDDEPAAAPTTRSRVVWFLVALACALLTGRLGLWQLSRAHQKISAAALIAERGHQPALPVVELARGDADGAAQWQRHVVLQGQWDPAHTVYLMNRTMDERAGFFVMTPLRLPAGDAVVVQRGWVARDDVDPMKVPVLATPAGPVQVQGHVAPWPSHWIDIGHGAGGPVRQNLERAPFAAEAGIALRPVTLIEDANADNAHDGLRRDWPAPEGSVVTNYGYAFQWFAMSIAFLGLYAWLQFFRKRPGAARDASDHPGDA